MYITHSNQPVGRASGNVFLVGGPAALQQHFLRPVVHPTHHMLALYNKEMTIKRFKHDHFRTKTRRCVIKEFGAHTRWEKGRKK